MKTGTELLLPPPPTACHIDACVGEEAAGFSVSQFVGRNAKGHCTLETVVETVGGWHRCGPRAGLIVVQRLGSDIKCSIAGLLVFLAAYQGSSCAVQGGCRHSSQITSLATLEACPLLHHPFCWGCYQQPLSANKHPKSARCLVYFFSCESLGHSCRRKCLQHTYLSPHQVRFLPFKVHF